MDRLAFLVFTTILLIFSACKTDSNTDNPVASAPIAEKNVNPNKRGKVNSKLNIPELRAQALSILNHRLKSEPKTYAIIDHDLWEYKFVFDGKMSAQGEYNGVWIDFHEDHTYEYGKRNVVNGSGRYNYHIDRGELLLVDNDSTKKPEEYKAKLANGAMILEGTITYRDRHVQMKLENVTDKLKQAPK